MARLLWMVEDLTYEEALRGTGWGRRRGWFRDALHRTTTLAQVLSHGFAAVSTSAGLRRRRMVD